MIQRGRLVGRCAASTVAQHFDQMKGVVVIAHEPTHIYAPTLYTRLHKIEYQRTAGYLGRRAWLRSRLVLLWQDNEAADDAMYDTLATIESAFDSTDLAGAITGKIHLESAEPGFLPLSGTRFRLLDIMTSALLPSSTTTC